MPLRGMFHGGRRSQSSQIYHYRNIHDGTVRELENNRAERRHSLACAHNARGIPRTRAINRHRDVRHAQAPGLIFSLSPSSIAFHRWHIAGGNSVYGADERRLCLHAYSSANADRAAARLRLNANLFLCLPVRAGDHLMLPRWLHARRTCALKRASLTAVSVTTARA